MLINQAAQPPAKKMENQRIPKKPCWGDPARFRVRVSIQIWKGNLSMNFLGLGCISCGSESELLSMSVLLGLGLGFALLSLEVCVSLSRNLALSLSRAHFVDLRGLGLNRPYSLTDSHAPSHDSFLISIN